ncbi:hypothetical protein THPR109532_15170 [Thalassospira profundimaris]
MGAVGLIFLRPKTARRDNTITIVLLSGLIPDLRVYGIFCVIYEGLAVAQRTIRNTHTSPTDTAEEAWKTKACCSFKTEDALNAATNAAFTIACMSVIPKPQYSPHDRSKSETRRFLPILSKPSRYPVIGKKLHLALHSWAKSVYSAVSRLLAGIVRLCLHGTRSCRKR